MQKNDLPLTAVVLIAIGVTGIFATTWIGGPSFLSGAMSSTMMGGGMMDRDQMKEMMQGMMSGILPPGIKPEDLPNTGSPGARLTATYCVQCHNLPSPRMHAAEEWPGIAGRMIAREQSDEVPGSRSRSFTRLPKCVSFSAGLFQVPRDARPQTTYRV